MTASTTRTSTQTSTFTKVVYVTRKVQADFLAILDTYGYFSEEYAVEIMHDVRVLLDEEVIDRVRFIWTRSGTARVLEELAYAVLQGGIGLADDRPGGITYRTDLAGAQFGVRLTYNARWKQLSEEERDAIRSALTLRWGPAGELDYSGGRWVTERTYSQDGYGLSRSRFTR